MADREKGKNMRISVAMATYNGARFITEQLDSIRKLYENRNSYIEAMQSSKQLDSINQIVSIIESCIA